MQMKERRKSTTHVGSAHAYIKMPPTVAESEVDITTSTTNKNKPGEQASTNTHATESVSLFQIFELYTRRWFILAIFCLLSLCNGMMWITFSPISTFVEEQYNISSVEVNMLSLIYMILYLPFVFVSSYIIDQRGLRLGIIVGATANCVGAWIRCIPGHYAWVLIGQAINAFAQTFLLSAPVKIAGNWFGQNERTTATSIGFRTSVPPTPPSQTAATEKTHFFKGILSVAKLWPFWILFVSFGVSLGAFYALCTLLNQYLEPYNYSQANSGLLGSLILFIGLAGALTAGPLLDKTKKYRLLCVASFLGFFGGMLWFALELKADNFVSLLLCCGFIGIFSTAMLPIVLEAGVEATYPVAEGLSSGLLLWSAQFFGIIVTLVLGEIQEKYGTKEAVYGQMGLAGGAFIIILFFKTKYKRLLAENIPTSPI